MKNPLLLLMSQAGVSQREGETGKISCRAAALFSWKEDSYRKLVRKETERKMG